MEVVPHPQLARHQDAPSFGEIQGTPTDDMSPEEPTVRDLATSGQEHRPHAVSVSKTGALTHKIF